MNRIGYCCIPLGCNANKKKKDHLQVNRGMVKKTFEAKGIAYASELILANLKDTLEVLKYNVSAIVTNFPQRIFAALPAGSDSDKRSGKASSKSSVKASSRSGSGSAKVQAAKRA